MATLAEIEQTVRSLAPEDLAAFRAWFANYDADAWDDEIAADVASGKLDALADQALADLRAYDRDSKRD